MVSERDVGFRELVSGLAVDELFRTTDAPPAPRPAGRGELVDLGVDPGQCGWSLWRFDADADVAVHHTDSVDFDLVVEGSIELVLDDGAHLLQPGDCVVVTGVDHAWRAGPAGCVVSAIALGSRPRT